MRRAVLLWAVFTVSAMVLGACGGSDGSGGATPSGDQGATLRVSGSTTVNPVAVDAAEVLRKQGMKITVDSQGGSAGGIAQLGRGQVEIAMSSKPIAAEDHQMFPSVDFVATEIGQDAVGIVVRREVADAGVTNLTKDEARAIFETRVSNWKELGGPDLEVFVYDKEPGRGTREQLDKYLYGPDGKAPPPPQSDNFAVVGGNEETRSKLLSTPGSVGPLSTSFIAGYPKLAALALDGAEPSAANIKDGRYPMSRPLFLVTNGPPKGAAKRLIDFVLSGAGQELVDRHGYLTRADLGLS
ncbi:MAG TPA: phosphate ABC transporter substrate-binding protein [Acidimicrobiales bacterium]|nr:phosphate ABC transporter substrate-binding protein [Acidimicrobiales bacterium]